MNAEKYKNDLVLYAEEVLGLELYEYQKEFLRRLTKIRKEHPNKQIFMTYPHRSGRIMVQNILEKHSELP